MNCPVHGMNAASPMGAWAFTEVKLQCVNRGRHYYVPAEFMKWVKVGGKIMPGLVKRRTLEARLYQGSLNEY